MKRLKTILLFLVICISCFAQNRTRTNTSTNTNNTTSQRVTWEYEIIKVNDSSINWHKQSSPEFHDQTSMLNLMGSSGWELVSVYTEIATEFPNFGEDRYVTGIRSNTKTQVINFVFKRPKSGK